MSTAKELRAKSAADLQKELLELRREQFNLRMARATGQDAKPDQFTKVRRNIARLKTVAAEQRRSTAGQSVSPTTAAEKAPSAKATKKAPAKTAQKKGKKS
jgi:large subunit ribosomal protein L29